MPGNHSNTNRIITILIHLIKRIFKTFSLCYYMYIALLRTWRCRCFHGINAMILMSQIFDVIANENAHYKCNELEWSIYSYVCILQMYIQRCGLSTMFTIWPSLLNFKNNRHSTVFIWSNVNCLLLASILSLEICKDDHFAKVYNLHFNL